MGKRNIRVVKLTARFIATVTEPGWYKDADGRNLYLHTVQGARGINKNWAFIYMLGKRTREISLGSADLVSLAEAREAALNYRRLKSQGIDPKEHRNAARAPATGATFEECAERLIASYEAGWKNEKHRAQWRNTLKTYAYPKLAKLPVQSIDVGHILSALEPIWTTKAETANRVRGRIEAVLSWASARGYRTGDNPARWRGHLDHLLPAQRKVSAVKHHEALPYKGAPAFVAELRERPALAARALEFTILTAARTGEVIGARWAEINAKEKLWTVPASRMKGGREHRVTLSDRALAILEELPKGGDFVFAGADGKPISNMAMLQLLKRMGRDGLTVHGFRSAFKDWASEETAFSQDISEMALAHAISDKTEAAYRRGDLLEKRRALMADWAAFCGGPATAR